MASSTFYLKPELALRRAIELQGIEQDAAALELLHEVISSRRHRTWSPAFEQIMIAYLDLCLKLHRSREAKDGLHQYRNLSQSQAPGSLEKVIRYLMEAAEAKCRSAKALVDADGIATEEDFDTSPQAILLSTMSTDPTKTQRDSAVLLPSLKFLWETYRAVLDILRSNSKLEHVYHAAAQNALRFCRLYRRRMEFRHLTDMLRTHLGNLRQYGNLFENDENTKSSNKVRGWDGWTAESIELHLQTRFAQLETASVLHRYTEGFRTCEDIFHILQVSQARKRVHPDAPAPKPKLMASYYEKLTTLFWVSENHLFHAYAWYKYYTLCKEYNRGMSEEVKQRQASAVLLAALCIPSVPQNSAAGSHQKQHGITTTVEDDIVKQKMARMATLLGFHTRNPTREALLTEIRSKDLLDQVPAYLRELYFLLELNSDPLIMVEKAQPLLETLKKEIGNMTTSDEDNEDVEDTTLGRYVKPLTSVLLLKLIVNLSKAYHTVSMDFLKSLTSNLDMSFEQVEKALVLFTQTKTLSVRIDHRAGCLRFGDTQLESNAMRSQLTVLAKQLETVSVQVLQPPNQKALATQRAAAYNDIRANVAAEHTKILERKNLIEQRKELEERMAQEKQREELRKKMEEEAERRKEEELRIAREQKQRELEKQRKIQQELENKEKMRFLVAMGKNTEEISEEQMAAIDTKALQKEHQDKINKQKEDAERKLKEAAKKLDYLVRAIRIEELPIVKKKYDKTVQKERERYEQETREKVELAKKQWEADVKDKAALETHGVFKHIAAFQDKVMAGREIRHEKLCKDLYDQAEIEAEKAKIKRARDRKNAEVKRLAEEEQRRKEEEDRKRQEEEERAKEEARREREAKERAAREAEERRMEEEDRRRQEKAAAAAAPPPSSGGSRYVPPSKRSTSRGAAGPGGGGGGGGGSRFGGGSEYPGGGRYRGAGDRRGFDERDRRGGGYGDDRRGGGGGYGDDRRGPGGGGGGGFGDRRGGPGGFDRDRGAGGGGGGYGDRRRDDRGGAGDRGQKWR